MANGNVWDKSFSSFITMRPRLEFGYDPSSGNVHGNMIDAVTEFTYGFNFRYSFSEDSHFGLTSYESLYDKRLGESHWQVPGPDGKKGFGGSCFPKDIQALIMYAKELGINPSVLLGVWEKNLDVRPERDWEALKGRAVSE